ncbi:MAG: hypothetical protein HYU64_04540 [Armatimonadetes bacterium]|nr:hypothetical protein [Armatimonadota bacterium]
MKFYAMVFTFSLTLLTACPGLAKTPTKAQPAKPLPSRISMELQDAKLADIIQYVVKRMGKNAIVDKSVSQVVTLTLENISPEEALKLLLKTHHLATRQMNRSTLYVGTEQQVRAAAPVLSQAVPLKYARAGDVAEYLLMLLNRPPRTSLPSKRSSPVKGGGEKGSALQIVHDDRNNSILLRGIPEDIQEAISVISLLDVPTAATITETVVLKQARASQTAAFLVKLMDQETGDSKVSKTGIGLPGRYQFFVDERTNSIVITATPVYLARIKALLTTVLDRGASAVP